MYRVLIADDEASTRNGLKSFLDWRSLGVEEVLLAADGQEALRTARQSRPDLVISDIRMPKLGGIAFASKLRELLPQCKLIFISGYSDKEYMKAAIQLKAIRYVEKPISPEELYGALEEAVRELESDRMVQALTDQSEVLRQELALELIEGKPEEALREKIRLTCPGLLEGSRYRTLLLQSGDSVVSGASYLQIEEQVKRLFGDCLTARTETNRLLFHVSGPYLENPLLFKSNLQRLQKSLRSCLSGEEGCFLAAGECVSGFGELRRSYDTAREAARSLFFTGYDACAVYGKGHTQKYLLPGGAQERLEQLLREGTRDEAAAFLGETAAEMEACPGTDSGYIRHIFFQFASKLCAIAQERDISLREGGDYSAALWQEIFGKSLFAELYGSLCELLDRYYTEFDRLRLNRPVYLMKQYMEQNYDRPGLSIQDLSAAVHLTPSHLCHIFKEETGQTINQYLTGVRMEKAKLLLRRPDVRLTEVTERIGYTDANYFTRQFKKLAGVTPSEYRTAHLG